MRLFLLTSFTMIAFASNSILTRMAIEPGFIDPISFALIRVLAGAVFLCLMVLLKAGKLPWTGRGRLLGASSLAVYMIGFSLAYVTLDAGLGALILFGVVQISMFSFSALIGLRPGPRQLAGAAIAFLGLMIALWPDQSAGHSVSGALFMVVAGLGWAGYSLVGKNARNPLAETAANFAICLPMLLLLTGFFVDRVTLPGVLLAVLCGAVTSGLGYALWYRVLPDLQRNVAAVVQLSVPIIAILAGALLLGEPLTPAVLLAAALVILGVAMAVTKQSVPEGRS
ncbi:MAG: DMT family transporter [Pseudomonadota bacterium]